MIRPIVKIRQFVANGFGFLVITLVICSIAFVTEQIAFGAAQQKSFSSPEEAFQALMAAVKTYDKKALLEILGPEAKAIIDSGDQVSDREAGARFAKSYAEANKLVKVNDDMVVLQVGKDEWTFPIPVAKEKTGWLFNTKEGKQEILNRRIG